MLRASLLIAVTACSTAPPSDDVVGPFTGARHRFVIDRFELPRNTVEARELGDDLDGDLEADNALGSVLSTLAGQDNLTMHADDMLASGAISSSIEIQADDLVRDHEVGVWYFGAAGDPATPVGGRIIDGVFAGNRTATTLVPGKAVVRLPVFVDADPTEIEIVGLELDLTPDGRGGYDALVRGGVRHQDVITAAHLGIVQLLEARPHDHRTFWWLVDRDRDGTISRTDLESEGLIPSLLEPDLTLTIDGAPTSAVSVGFRVHLTPCAAGRCAPTTSIDRCFDRVLDADESDVDCGGSCGDCGATRLCRTGADCQTGGCDGGLCRAPTCGDGVHNGFESGIDCGGACAGCPSFATCAFDSDCASGTCSTGTQTCY